MPKLLHITKRYPPYIGGIETVCFDMANALKDRYDQMVLAFNDKDETIDEIYNGVRVVRASVFKVVASQPLSKDYGKLLDDAFRNFKPDIIHFDYPNPYAAAFLLKAMKKYKFKGKFLLFWHMDIVKQKLLRSLFIPQTKALLKRADLVIATSPNYLKDTSFLPKYKGRVAVLPLKVGDDRLEFTSSQSELSNQIKEKYKGKKIIFFFGRHVKYKGLRYLIESNKYLNQDEVEILIAGKGKLTNELKEEAAPYKNIEFVGVIKDEEINAYLDACYLFAFPSITRNEAFGISLAEALYFGKPALTFTIKGSGVNYVNINDETGLEAPNEDVKSYADNINRLLHDEALYKKLSIGAKERALTLFSKEHFVKTLNEIFDKLDS